MINAQIEMRIQFLNFQMLQGLL